MNDVPQSRPSRLPPGETDVNKLYVAVGRAINTWENMELALARLFLKLSGIPDAPQNYAAYGAANRRLSDRLIALARASESYFIKNPNQSKECDCETLLMEVQDLAIERHRIAHGNVSMFTEIPVPTNLKPGEKVEITLTFTYRWAAPFYSTATLRTNPVGKDSEAIDGFTAKFNALHKRIYAFTESLP